MNKLSDGSRFVDVSELKRMARDRWPSILADSGVQLSMQARNGHHGPCPGCGGKDRFRFVDEGGNGTFFCSRGGQGTVGGDGFNLLMHVLAIDFKSAIQLVAERVSVPQPISAKNRPPRRQADKELNDREASFKALIADCVPITEETDVAAYLRERGLKVPIGSQDLLMHQNLDTGFMGTRYPAMVGLVRDVSDSLVGLHLTFIANGKKAMLPSPRRLVKLSADGLSGSAIHLGTPASTLIVGEGLESALAAAQLGEEPAWCAGSAALLAKMQVPAHVTKVIIYPDNDQAGLQAAKSLKDRLRRCGKHVETRVAPRAGYDPLDWLVAARPEALAPKVELPLGSRMCQCPACGEVFRSDSVFDKHRIGLVAHKICMTPAEMALAGMKKVEGRWVARHRPKVSSV